MKYTQTNEWKEYLELAEKRPALFAKNEALEIIFDKEIINRYAEEHDAKLGVAYTSNWHMMVVDLVKDINGRVFPYERIVPTSDGSPVVIVPCYEDKYVLLRQFRHALRKEQLAFPRGFGEDGLDAVENAKKELVEELNAAVIDDSVIVLGQVTADSGLTAGVVSVVGCKIMNYDLKRGYEEIEDVILVTDDELQNMIRAGRITDGFTLSAYEMWREYKG